MIEELKKEFDEKFGLMKMDNLLQWDWIEEKLKQAKLDSMHEVPHIVKVEDGDSYNKAIDNCMSRLAKIGHKYLEQNDYTLASIYFDAGGELEKLKEKK